MVNKNKIKYIDARFKEFDDFHYSCGWMYFTLTFSIFAVSFWALFSAPFGGFIFAFLTIVNLLSINLYVNAQFDNWIYEHKLYCVECDNALVTQYKHRYRHRPRGYKGKLYPKNRPYGKAHKKCPYCDIPITQALGLNKPSKPS